MFVWPVREVNVLRITDHFHFQYIPLRFISCKSVALHPFTTQSNIEQLSL